MSDRSQPQPSAFDVEIASHDSQPGGNRGGICAKLNQMSQKFDIETKWGYRLYIAAYLIVVLMHPLHYYAYVIKPEQNCLDIEIELYATIAVVSFCNAYMLLYTPNFIRKFYKTGGDSKTTLKHPFFFTQVPVLLMTSTLLPDLTRGTQDKIFLTTANLFLFCYILLVIGLSLTIKNAIATGISFVQGKWVKAAYNLFLYLLGGHVFGALWYSFAVDRVLVCWRDDYFLRKSCNPPHSFVCRHRHRNMAEFNCPKIKTNVTEINEFGIFNEALQSGIVYLNAEFPKKLIYCLRWGLQALSCFGQNMTPSTNILENIFVVSITIYSTVLFAFLIGSMQNYLTSEEKSEEEKKQGQKKEPEEEEQKKAPEEEVVPIT